MLREAERLAQPGCSRKEAGLTRTPDGGLERHAVCYDSSFSSH